MKIIKHGKKTDDEELYYHCYKCSCQFKATKEESKYFDGDVFEEITGIDVRK